MLNGLFTQIVFAALAIGIAVTYVQPTFTEIGEVQSSIADYEREIGRVSEVNERLDALVAQADQLTAADQRALLTYLPDSVDIVSIPRDISVMAERAGVLLRSVGYDGEVSYFQSSGNGSSQSTDPVAHGFVVQIEGTYEQIKEFLRLTERNEYPLQIGTLDIGSDQEGFMDAGVTLITFTFEPDESTDS